MTPSRLQGRTHTATQEGEVAATEEVKEQTGEVLVGEGTLQAEAQVAALVSAGGKEVREVATQTSEPDSLAEAAFGTVRSAVGEPAAVQEGAPVSTPERTEAKPTSAQLQEAGLVSGQPSAESSSAATKPGEAKAPGPSSGDQVTATQAPSVSAASPKSKHVAMRRRSDQALLSPQEAQVGHGEPVDAFDQQAST
jgi:hypothetical protein